MKRLLAALAILTVIFAAVVTFVVQDDSNRPEGPTERWLAAISRDTDTGAIAKYGDVAAAQDLLGFEIDGGGTTNRKHLDRYEVGPGTVSGATAQVPVQVWAKGADEPAQFTLTLTEVDGVWKISAAAPSTADVAFPSEGGQTFGIPLPNLVLISLIVGVVTFVAAVGLVRIAGARPLHRR